MFVHWSKLWKNLTTHPRNIVWIWLPWTLKKLLVLLQLKLSRRWKGLAKSIFRECLLDRIKPIDDPIHRNKVKVFKTPTTRTVSKQKQQLTSLFNNAELFSRLYISWQTRDGDLQEFSSYKNQASPLSLSDEGHLSKSAKSYLLSCLEDLRCKIRGSCTTTVVLDRAAIVQMLKPAACKNLSIHMIFSSPIYLQNFSHHHIWTWHGTAILLTHSKLVLEKSV